MSATTAPTQQLPLELALKETFTFKNYISGENSLAVNLLEDCANGGETQLYLWSDARLGKSHLLQAACHRAGLQKLTATYIPARELQKLSPEVFEGLESLQLVCIDDVHVLLENKRWELPLFDLVNRVREAGSHLVVSSNCSPAALSLVMPDLESRLCWGPVLQILPLDDHGKSDAIQQRAESSGLELPGHVANYMLHHLPRDLATLLERMDALDSASLAQQKRLTIPFVKSVLGVDQACENTG